MLLVRNEDVFVRQDEFNVLIVFTITTTHFQAIQHYFVVIGYINVVN